MKHDNRVALRCYMRLKLLNESKSWNKMHSHKLTGKKYFMRMYFWQQWTSKVNTFYMYLLQNRLERETKRSQPLLIPAAFNFQVFAVGLLCRPRWQWHLITYRSMLLFQKQSFIYKNLSHAGERLIIQESLHFCIFAWKTSAGDSKAAI